MNTVNQKRGKHLGFYWERQWGRAQYHEDRKRSCHIGAGVALGDLGRTCIHSHRGVGGMGGARSDKEGTATYKLPSTKADGGCGLSELLGVQQDGSAGGGPGVEDLSFTR